MYYLLISKNSLGELFTRVCVSKVHKLLSTQVVSSIAAWSKPAT